MSAKRLVVVAVLAALVLPAVLLAPVPAPAAAQRANDSYERTVTVAIADIQNYWSDTFPDVYGARYQRIPPNRIFAGRPGVKLPPCGGERLRYRDVADNAFYCLGDN